MSSLNDAGLASQERREALGALDVLKGAIALVERSCGRLSALG